MMGGFEDGERYRGQQTQLPLEEHDRREEGKITPNITGCPHRRDDSYMEGPGEFYCEIWLQHARNEGGLNVGATFSCNFNCENGRCPKGYRK